MAPIVQHRGAKSSEGPCLAFVRLPRRSTTPFGKFLLKFEPSLAGARIITRISMSFNVYRPGNQMGMLPSKRGQFLASH